MIDYKFDTNEPYKVRHVFQSQTLFKGSIRQLTHRHSVDINCIVSLHLEELTIQFPRPQLVVHAVYHKERCSPCGQLDVKYCGKVDISIDNIFLFKLFFLGFFSVCLPNIYFNIFEYLSTLDSLSFDKSDLLTLCHTKIYSISGTRPLALVVEWGNRPLWAFFVVGHQRIILTGVLPISSPVIDWPLDQIHGHIFRCH